MENLIELIKALIWPVATIWLGYMFRHEVRQLLDRVSKLKYKDMEADFEKSLAEAESNAKKITQSNTEDGPRNLSQKEQLLRISEISPRAAVVEAWTLIETSATKNGLVSGTVIPRTNAKMIIDCLDSSGKFSPYSLALINQLRQIRNKATHMPDFSVTQLEAERYLDLAVKASAVIGKAVS